MYDHVIWPKEYDPKTSALYALNDIDVEAPPDVVWKLLIDAEHWSKYFPAENQVKILSGDSKLALGTKWTRVTVGIPTRLVVAEYKPVRKLAWATTVDGDETGSTAYHGWVITPTKTGCHVLSEETQQGPYFLEALGRKNPGGLYKYHQEWVESLKRAAEAEPAESKGSGSTISSHPEEFDMKIVRTIEDRPYVVMQLKLESSGENIFAIYRFQDGRIVEHSAFSSPDAPPNLSGHTQLDGPTEPQCLEDTEKNKAFARRYYETFHLAANHVRNNEFFTGDLMIRHEPGVRDGLQAFLHDVDILMQNRTIDELKLLVGQGDLIFILAKGTHEGKPCAYLDLYRVENEKIVEHWGFPQMLTPPTESTYNAAAL